MSTKDRDGNDIEDPRKQVVGGIRINGIIREEFRDSSTSSLGARYKIAHQLAVSPKLGENWNDPRLLRVFSGNFFPKG